MRLEFFKHRHNVYGSNPKKDLLNAGGILRNQVSGAHEPEVLIHEEMAVSKLEQLFLEHFSLSVQVFRKSGKSWLETTLTDDWSLKKQNEQGAELSALNS